jgi:hypothetical protein
VIKIGEVPTIEAVAELLDVGEEVRVGVGLPAIDLYADRSVPCPSGGPRHLLRDVPAIAEEGHAEGGTLREVLYDRSAVDS